MPRSRRSQPIGPDHNYQLPHPDLVTDPPTLLDRTQQHLTRFKFLWEQLGLQALALQGDIRDLEAAGGCPDQLVSSIHQAISRVLSADLSPDVDKGKGGRGDGDGDGDEGTYHDHDIGENIPMGESEGVGDFEERRLAEVLRGIKVADPVRLIRAYGPRAVSEVLEMIHARPAGEVVSPGAYLRAVLRKYKPAQMRKSDGNRYTRGKYGHVVQS